MRLVNTDSLHLEDFINQKIPKYAILSHTWDHEEVSFADMTGNQSFCHKKGYRKIVETCQKASKAGYSYAWIDTCCIDKSSSAELTEAINSMYLWYQRSEICYVFLSDFPVSASVDFIQDCRWFKRGWTLQELIAPRNVYFFDKSWTFRGSKTDLLDQLSRITRIDARILNLSQPLSSVAVAQRMSWAADRKTTRIEDQAYCLLGIFGVNMPLLYGEEHRAFQRLQGEIIKIIPDFSIFAWRLPHTTRRANDLDRTFCGILAESPTYFAESKLLSKTRSSWQEFSVTNIGVKVEVQVLSMPIPGKKSYRYVLPLYCTWDTNMSIGLFLRKCGPDQFVREDPWNFAEVSESLWPNAPRVRYLLTELPTIGIASAAWQGGRDFIPQTRSHALEIDLPEEIDIEDAWPWGRYDDEDQLFFLSGNDQWDSATLKLITTLKDSKGKDIEFKSMFYAVGWSSENIRHLQCTIVDYEEFSNDLNDVQTQISGWNHNSYQVRQHMKDRKIPKSPAVHVNIPGTETTAVISFSIALQNNPRICGNRFWKVKFSSKLHQKNDLPRNRSGRWW